MPKLILLPSLRAKKVSDVEILVTEKFILGVQEFANYWQGEIEVIFEEDQFMSDNLDNKIVNSLQSIFKFSVINYDSNDLINKLAGANIVLAAVSYRQNHISQLCNKIFVPCVYITEYTLNTRWQIVTALTKNPILRLRRWLWEYLQERKQTKAIEIAQGVQSNGVPTYDVYRLKNANTLLFFDTRVLKDMLVPEQLLSTRLKKFLEGNPIQLVFSGRLIKIKGALDLIYTARELKKRKLHFQMTICGDGSLLKKMQQLVTKFKLEDVVVLKGNLNFQSELMPFVQQYADLFVCCHLQGDPSCTYLETMSCGVPIVGYANEALTGIVNASAVGWVTPIYRPDLLADKILEIDADRQRLALASMQALSFASKHTFEKSVSQRMSQLQSLAKSK